MDSQNKNIVICSDGTGNTTIKGRGTNVFKLFEAVDVNGHRSDPNLRRQLAFYDDGVGTEDLKWIRAIAGATGYGLSRNVKQLYRELCRAYEPGDGIYLFGFSRGAFTVRTLSGLISDCGVIDATKCRTEDEFREVVRCAYKAYRRKYRAWLTKLLVGPDEMSPDEFRRKYARKDALGQAIVPAIRMLGVWDTVDAVGLPFSLADVWNKVIWQYKFETATLCGAVEKGCHALALDDGRAEFAPVLWNESDPSTRHRVEQVWFAGAHSNVGGGYPQQGMSLVTLDWMMKHAEAQGLRFVGHTRDEYTTQHSFADKLYDPRSGLGMFYRWKPRDVVELSAKRGIRVPRVHISAIERLVQAPQGYAPGNIPVHCEVVCTEDHPSVRLDELAVAIANAHVAVDANSLQAQKRRWVGVGLAAYVAFLGGFAATLLRVLSLMITSPAEGLGPFLRSVGRVITSFPSGILLTLWRDWIALSLLLGGLAIGYGLSATSAHRMKRYYSGFWHKHRPALRTALRRTPAPEEAVEEPGLEKAS